MNNIPFKCWCTYILCNHIIKKVTLNRVLCGCSHKHKSPSLEEIIAIISYAVLPVLMALHTHIKKKQVIYVTSHMSIMSMSLLFIEVRIICSNDEPHVCILLICSNYWLKIYFDCTQRTDGMSHKSGLHCGDLDICKKNEEKSSSSNQSLWIFMKIWIKELSK